MALILLAFSLLILWVVLLGPIYSFIRDDRHLKSFPSPSIAGYSSLWRIYQNFRYKQFQAVHDAHAKFGTHVRIAPNHVSVCAPDAVDQIYGHGANMLKDAWYEGGAGEARTMADTRSKPEHQDKRRRMAHLFAAKSIVQMEALLRDRTQCLFRKVRDAGAAKEALNVRRYFNYFTIDVISAIMFGEHLGCLERGNDLVDAETRDGKVYTTPLIRSLHAGMRLSVPLGYEPDLLPITRQLVKCLPQKPASKGFDDIVYRHVRKVLRRGYSSSELTRSDGYRDFITQFLYDKDGKPTNVPLKEILAETSGMLNAGSDTTSTAITNTIYLLYHPSHATILQRLRADVTPVFAACQDMDDLPSYDKLSSLPYLRACIDETMRLRPSSAFGLPREVPRGGREIAGKFIAGGVSVSVPTFSILRDKTIFSEPDRYFPERWLPEGDGHDDDPRLRKMKKFFVPFSTGPRACIGRNIAYFEMTMVVATVVHWFDFAFRDEDVVKEFRVLERVNANPDELWLYPRVREAVQ
jgi:cytochrome P450